MPSGKKSAGDVSEAAEKRVISEEQKEEEKKQAAAEAAKNRSATLEKLVTPSNLPPIKIYWGSQTGTAEKFAGVLDEEAQVMNLDTTQVVDFFNFKEEEFAKQPLVIICIATHYEGDPCDNTRPFYKWFKTLLKKKQEKPFAGMKFCTFGLADSSYEQFNQMGKEFDAGFEQLGAERLYDMGVGNAETFSTEDDFNKWKETLWSKIFEHYAAS